MTTPLPTMAATGLAAYVLAIVGMICIVLWWRDRETGMVGLGLSASLMAVFYATDAAGTNLPAGSYFLLPAWLGLVLQLAVVSFALGMARYLGLRPGLQQPLVPLLLLPNIVLGAMHLAQWPIHRNWGNVALTLVFAVMAGLAWRARRAEPYAGHGVLAVTILMLPLSSWALVLAQNDAIFLRYLAIPALLLMFMVLLTVSSQRRRRALEVEVLRRRQAEATVTELNTTLEARIAQRTADLSNIVAGLESFNRSVSHDLRGPLGGMQGLAEVGHGALQQGDVQTAQEMLGAIAKQAGESHQLVASLLDLAKVDAAQPRHQPVLLAVLANEVVQQCRSQGLATEQTVFDQHSLRNLPLLQADAGLLRMVLMNLVGNACKFSSQREPPQVEVGAQRRGNELVVFVRDNGVGLAPASASRLFQPFKRLHGGDFQGHGVGLSIVRRAVVRMGGVVWAEGLPELGATFYFSLPQALPEASGAER